MRIAYIIAQKDFRDEEYLKPKAIFEKMGYKVDSASIEKGKAYGKLGAVADVDIAIKDLEPEKYDAIVIAGGPGAVELGRSEELLELIREAYKKGKIVAAICIAPMILAKSGILENKTATIWNGNGKQSEALESYGASYSLEPVVVDGNIVTANGPEAAEDFGEAIVELLEP